MTKLGCRLISYVLLLVDASLLTGGSDVSRVDVDLALGLVTGYSDRVQFLTPPTPPTPPSDNTEKRCGRRSVIRVELGGRIQVAKVSLRYSNPHLWTFHVADTQLADGYGDVFLRDANTTSTTELFVVNQQLRIYTHFPPYTMSSWADLPTGSAQWMALRVVDDTVQKMADAELTLDLKNNAVRWQDGRLAHDFLAPPGLFHENGSTMKKIILYISMNRIIADDWRSGEGLCHLTLKLMDNDEDQCHGVPSGCDPNAVCKQSRRFQRCSCRKGWEGDGKTCRDVDECRIRNGGCVHTCTNLPGTYSCSCLRGFMIDPDDDHNCLDVDECSVRQHGCQRQCVNTVGSYECECAGKRTTPQRRHCQHEDSPCLHHGCHHACVAGLYGNVKACSCWPDHQLNTTDNKSCVRKCRLGNGGCQHHCLDTETGPVCTCQYSYLLGLDGRKCTASCSVNNGGCQKRCANTDVGVLCSCPNGFVLNDDGKTCADIDECTVANGGCQHDCLNGVGYYECTCPRGYKIDPSDEKTCVDVDECSLNTTCEHECINTPGSYACSCKTGYQLFGGTHCGDIDECFIANGGCKHLCSNTEGSFRCSANITKKIDFAAKHRGIKCQTANTSNSGIARGRVLIDGMTCSQTQDLTSHIKECIERLVSEHLIECNLQVVNAKCLKTNTHQSVFRRVSNETVKLGLKIYCIVRNESKSCGVPNCSSQTSEHLLSQALAMLKNIFNNDTAPSLQIQSYEVSIIPKSFRLRDKHKKKICFQGSKTKTKDRLTPGNKSSVFPNLPKHFSSKCLPGFTWNADSQRCVACVKGTYQKGNDNICYKCPGNSTTDGEASVNIDSCKRFECNSYINDLQGYIQSPNYPGNYPNNVVCTWVIKPPKGRRLLVIVPEINFAGNKCADHIVMRKSKSPFSVITFEACKSLDTPLAFVAESKRLWIQFRSDDTDSSTGFHIPFVTYNEEYQALMEDIVQDRRLYSSQNHLEILRDKKLMDALIEVIAQPINYYKYSNDQRKMFPSSFIRLMTPKVRKFFSYKR